MKTYAVYVAVFCFASTLVYSKEKHIVSLYYAADCPVVYKTFYQQQIFNNWKKLKEKIILDLVPYGKSAQLNINGRWIFECQSLQKECLDNKLHSCAIHQACGQPDTRKCKPEGLDKVVRFIQCSLKSHDNQLEAVPRCSKNAGLEHNGIVQCAKGKEGSEYFSEFGKRTRAFTAVVDYCPMVAIDGVHDVEAEHNLLRRIDRLSSDV